MNTKSKDKILNEDGSRLATAEQRLKHLGIKLPVPPEPFGIYAEAVQTGSGRGSPTAGVSLLHLSSVCEVFTWKQFQQRLDLID